MTDVKQEEALTMINQFINGDIYINNNQILKTLIKSSDDVFCGNDKIKVNFYLI